MRVCTYSYLYVCVLVCVFIWGVNFRALNAFSYVCMYVWLYVNVRSLAPIPSDGWAQRHDQSIAARPIKLKVHKINYFYLMRNSLISVFFIQIRIFCRIHGFMRKFIDGCLWGLSLQVAWHFWPVISRTSLNMCTVINRPRLRWVGNMSRQDENTVRKIRWKRC